MKKEVCIDDVFKDLNKLKKNLFLFSCLKCKHYLFPSYDIYSIFKLRKKDFCFILNEEKNLNSNFKIEEKLLSIDDFLKIKGTYFKEVKCNNCKNLLGHQIILTYRELTFLLNKILIIHSQIIYYLVNEERTNKYIFNINLDKRIKEDNQFTEIDEFLCKTNENFFVKTGLIFQGRENILMNKQLIEKYNSIKNLFDYLNFLISQKINNKEKKE